MSALLQPRRLVTPFVVAVMIGGAMLTYQVKNKAIEYAEQVFDLRHQISQERIAISLLKAEWSELTQPGRLQELIARYPDVLNLTGFGIDRMVWIRDLPFPPEEQPDLIAEALMDAGR